MPPKRPRTSSRTSAAAPIPVPEEDVAPPSAPAPISTARAKRPAPPVAIGKVVVPQIFPYPAKHAATMIAFLEDVIAREKSDDRLLLLLRLIVAELRAAQSSIPATDPMRAGIVEALRRIISQAKERQVGYVFGLADAHAADWMGIAIKLRARIERMDDSR